MTDHDEQAGRAPEPQGRLAGLPYDFRAPTRSRIRARAWNPDDPRVFTPKAFGWALASTGTGWRIRSACSTLAVTPADRDPVLALPQIGVPVSGSCGTMSR